jgi:hypothetical protein
MSPSGPSRKSRNVRPESEMRGKTDISGFDYHDGNQAPAHGHEFTLAVRADDCVDRGSGAHVITLPSRSRPGAGCLPLVNRGRRNL